MPLKVRLVVPGMAPAWIRMELDYASEGQPTCL